MSEEYNMNTTIYNGVPEQEAAKRERQREKRASLPKLELAPGEELYIDKETIKSLNGEYFSMLDDMKRGFNIAPEDMRSFMESVVTASYMSEITQRQREGAEKAVPLNVTRDLENQLLFPGYVRPHFFSRKKANYPMRLCEEAAQLGAEREFANHRAKIEGQKKALFGEEPEETAAVSEELFDTLLEIFIPRFKRKRFKKKYGDNISLLLSELIRAAAIRTIKTPAETPEEDEGTPPAADEIELSDVDELDELYEMEEDTPEETQPQEVPEEQQEAPESAEMVSEEEESVEERQSEQLPQEEATEKEASDADVDELDELDELYEMEEESAEEAAELTPLEILSEEGDSENKET